MTAELASPAEGWFRTIVEFAPTGLLVADRSGRVALANREACAIFGHSQDELIGRDAAQLLASYCRAAYLRELELFWEETGTRAPLLELFALRKDRSELPIELELRRLDAPCDTQVLISVLDVSRHKQRENDLRRSNQELQEFAHVAAHDLQEPVRMVASYMELIAQRYRSGLDERGNKYVDYAVDGARRLQRMISDLLLYASVSAQVGPLLAVSAEDALGGALQALRGSIESARVEIDVGALPMVLADELQLGQLFQILLDNAVKFRRPDAARIEVRAKPERDTSVFSIKDNGIGIEMKHADRVFQIFTRLHERGKYDGNGVGLAVARRIVERHGGKLWLESELGQGTTLFFTLRTA